MSDQMQRVEQLRAQRERFQQLLDSTTARRQQAIQEGNREIAGKLHQGEREWKARIRSIDEEIAGLGDPTAVPQAE